MKKIVLLSVIASSMMMAGGDIAPVVEPIIEVPVVDDSGFYAGLAYGMVNEDYIRTVGILTDLGASFDEAFSTVMVQAGYKFNSYVAVEGRYWVGLDNVTPAAPATIYTTPVESPTAFGLYVKPMYPVTDALDIYALVGYAYTTTNEQDGVFTGNNLDGFSYGAGASYAFTENISAFVDYTVLYDDTVALPAPSTVAKEYYIDAINIGVTYSF